MRRSECSYRLGDRGERQDQGQRRVIETDRAVTLVPVCSWVIFGIDKQGNATDFLRDCHTAPPGGEQQTAAEAAALYRTVYGEPT